MIDGKVKGYQHQDIHCTISCIAVWALSTSEPEECVSPDPPAGEGKGGGGAAQSHRHHLHLLQPGGSPRGSASTKTGGVSLSLSLKRRNILVQELKLIDQRAWTN